MARAPIFAACCLLLTALPAAAGDAFDVHFAWTPGVPNHVTLVNPGDQPLEIQRIERSSDRWSTSGSCAAALRLAPRGHCSIDAALLDAAHGDAESSVVVSVYTSARPSPYTVTFSDGVMFSGTLAPASLTRHFWTSGLATRPVDAHQGAIQYIVTGIGGKQPGCEARVRFIGFRPGTPPKVMQQQTTRFSLLTLMNEQAALAMFEPTSACKPLQDQMVAAFRSYKPER